MIWRRVLVILIVLGLWEAVRRFNLVGPLLLASPSEIGAAFFKSWLDYVAALRFTATEIIVALAFAWTLGIATGTIAGLRPFLSSTAGPLLSSLFAVPIISWYPLFMVWFGIGISSKIVYAIVSGFFPIAINTMNGIRALDHQYILLGRAIGCSRRQIVFRIVLPMAMPSIVSGLRIGTALVVIGVIVAEMLASLGGIGYLISYYRSIYATAHVYLGILFALGCALLANWGLSIIERRFTYWRVAQIGEP
ncbi:MAG TPA: ABC transporter permease [Xanthobacteraceae bacterium]|jgi:NitT/TauT family transport system permease protein/taurine transport system permease protein